MIKKIPLIPFLLIMFLPYTSAIICNPELPNGCPSEPTGTTFNNNTLNFTGVNTNNSNFLNGNTSNDFWNIGYNQSLLTGNKTGSFIIDTTGTISSGDIALQDVGGNPSIRINNYYDGANDRRISDGGAFKLDRSGGLDYYFRVAPYGLSGSNIVAWTDVLTMAQYTRAIVNQINTIFYENVSMHQNLNVTNNVNVFGRLNATFTNLTGNDMFSTTVNATNTTTSNLYVEHSVQMGLADDTDIPFYYRDYNIIADTEMDILKIGQSIYGSEYNPSVTFYMGGTPTDDYMFYMKEDRASYGLFYLEGEDGGVLRVDTFSGNTNLDNFNPAGGDFYIGRDMTSGYLWLGGSGSEKGLMIPVGDKYAENIISLNKFNFTTDFYASNRGLYYDYANKQLNVSKMNTTSLNTTLLNAKGNSNITGTETCSILNTSLLNVKGNSNFTGYITASNISLTGIQGNVTFTNNVTFADTYYDDLNFPVANTKINPVTSKPDEDIQNVYYLFDDSSIETIRGSGQTSHTQKMGTPLNCHIHWIQTTTNGNVSWQLNYTLMALNSTNSTWLLLNSSINPVYNRTLGVNQISEFPVTEPIRTLSTIFRFKVSRIGDSVNDTLVGDAPFQSFDCHYQIDSLGSRMEYLK